MFDVTFGRGSVYSILLVGPSGSGKTHFIANFLRDRELLLHTPPAKVFLFYTHMQPIYKQLVRDGYVHHLVEGVPRYEELKKLVTPFKNAPGGSLIIFDDPASSIGSGDAARLFCELSHHTNASVIWISQTLFMESSEYRALSLNAKYMVLMKNPRQSREIVTLASQVRPYRTSFVVQSFMDATATPHSYMLLDFEQGQADGLRLRTNIFSHEPPMIAYMDRSSKT